MVATTSRERSPAVRLTAAERRNAIVDAAIHEFSLGGFDGTPAADIALRAGVSQSYLFALFGTKRNLFIAAVKRGLGLVQLQAFAACEDLHVRAATRAGFEETSRALASASGAPDRLLRSLPAEQALVSAAAAMDLPEAWS